MNFSVDTSVFGPNDVRNIALQRTDSLLRLPRFGSPSFHFWNKGSSWLLDLEARARRGKILDAAIRQIQEEFAGLEGMLLTLKPRHIADIGCGYAVFDLLASRTIDLEVLTLIDIEETDEKYHGFAERGAGYSSLEKASAFLQKNGVADSLIDTINPVHQALRFRTAVDLFVSFISCGFHYPPDDYIPVWLENLSPGGKVIIDIRKNQEFPALNANFREVDVLIDATKYRRVVFEVR